MRQKISQWPAIFVRVDPKVFERITAEAERRTLPASVLVREALDRAYRTEAR